MRFAAKLIVVVLAACGGTRAPADPPITNSIPPPPPPKICEDTVAVMSASETDTGLVIDDETFLDRAIRAHEPVLRACYAERLKHRPQLAGKVVLDITVGADGRATHVHTRGFDAELDRCLCEKLMDLRFETLTQGEVKASYPLYFTPPPM